jgi:hypothetical protein
MGDLLLPILPELKRVMDSYCSSFLLFWQACTNRKRKNSARRGKKTVQTL